MVTGESFISAMGVRGDGTIFGARYGNCINPEDILTVNPLNGDVSFIGSTGAGHVSDIAFSPNTYEPVPTLSEWARFISIFALGFIGLLAMRRRWSIKP